MSQMLRRRVAAEFRNEVALLQVAPPSDRGVLQTQREEQVLVRDIAIAPPLGIGLHQHVAEHGVTHERRIGDDLVWPVRRLDALADGHRHVFQHVDIHALVRRIDRRHAR